ncbi:olfactory receptor 56A1-like [Protopterus annectens]|uniref:olfactory receptor 56A1-like n=1 Tax=Protopterus annectens TaxID=7888 RepID=UPI001CFA64E0|nr:olfactory receptor 56A1-like [Protopterus annectens]
MDGLSCCSVKISNISCQDQEFVLSGFPGFENWNHVLSLPFTVMFFLMCFGNLTIMAIVIREASLHEPMYILICILAAADFVSGVTLLPSLLATLWYGTHIIPFNVCFIQMFFIYFPPVIASSLLVLMAYDRYVAVCNPLRYSSIMTNNFIFKGCVFIIIRSLCFIMPIPVIARMLTYCNKCTINNVFCDYFAVINNACTHTFMTDNYMTITLFLISPFDAFLIGLSYYMIISAAINLHSQEARGKVFSTCSSHLFVILIFYLSGTLYILVFIFENRFSSHIHAFFSILYIVIPSSLNPVIYGMKSKEIRLLVLKYLKRY